MTVKRGSSPLARGLPELSPFAVPAAGIIPARAGFTLFPSQWYRSLRGSSPLARGLPHLRIGGRCRCGIIPARAGFTPSGIVLIFATRDHPRSRGVYSLSIRVFEDRLGSSPLARGLRRWSRTLINRSGIIPARAGFTRLHGHCARRSKDHPRSRGVYYVPRGRRVGVVGSSPLARGLLLAGRPSYYV